MAVYTCSKPYTGPCTGVMLAGGMNSRFSGRNKAFLPIGGTPVIERVHDAFLGLFDEIILVTNDPRAYLKYDFTIVSDVFPLRCSLAGIHAGLFYAKNPHVFFSPCDTPFIKKEMIQTIVSRIDPEADAVIPETSQGLEPLCAVYSKRCLHVVEERLKQKKLKIFDVVKKRRVKKVPEKILRAVDPDLDSFININSPEDFKQCRSRFESRGEEAINPIKL